MAAVSRKGEPLPWYTYPCIDFLTYRSYEDKAVLEFGGGQSTLWWAKRAKHVVTLEGDSQWYERIKSRMPTNVDLHYVSMRSPLECVVAVEGILRSVKDSMFDVIVIDGLVRSEMIGIARRLMAEGGIIVCDNAEGYGFYEGFKDSGLSRVDFFGYAPGGVRPHATSIFFGSNSFAFSSRHPIPVTANDT